MYNYVIIHVSFVGNNESVLHQHIAERYVIVRPATKASEPVTVHVGFGLQQIKNLVSKLLF